MHINKLLRGKSVLNTHSDFLEENLAHESHQKPTPELDRFVSYVVDRDFADALKAIKGRSSVETSVFLMTAFNRDPIAGKEFLDFWKSSIAAQKHAKSIGKESFIGLEFSLNFNGHTYSADFEENPRVRLSELHLPKNPSVYKLVVDDSKVVDGQGYPLVVHHTQTSLPEARLNELQIPTSPAFKRWIASSEVQHIVYHATTSSREFNRPHAYSHFGTLDASHELLPKGYPSSNFWDTVDDLDATGALDPDNLGYSDAFSPGEGLVNARIMPFYLRITNGLEVHDFGGDHSAWSWVETMREVGTINEKTENLIMNSMAGNSEAFKLRLLTRIMKQLGYDGFMYINEIEDKGEWSYVPIYPWQIVSAIQAQNPNFVPPQSNIDPRQMSLFGESIIEEIF